MVGTGDRSAIGAGNKEMRILCACHFEDQILCFQQPILVQTLPGDAHHPPHDACANRLSLHFGDVHRKLRPHIQQQ